MLHKYVVEKKCLAAAIIPSCSVGEQKFANHPRFEALHKNSRPDRPERCEKASRDGGCRTLVPSGTGRQDSPGPGDGLGMDHFDPTRLKWGPQGRFDVLERKRSRRTHFKPLPEGGKTWETGPPVPHGPNTYDTSTPTPEPISKISKEKYWGRKHDVACSITGTCSITGPCSITGMLFHNRNVFGNSWHLLVTLVTLVHPYIWEHCGTMWHQQDVGGATYFPAAMSSVDLLICNQ